MLCWPCAVLLHKDQREESHKAQDATETSEQFRKETPHSKVISHIFVMWVPPLFPPSRGVAAGPEYSLYGGSEHEHRLWPILSLHLDPLFTIFWIFWHQKDIFQTDKSRKKLTLRPVCVSNTAQVHCSAADFVFQLNKQTIKRDLYVNWSKTNEVGGFKGNGAT